MNHFSNIWNIIVETNTFNFAILVLIFAIIFIKLDFGKIIDKVKIDIITAIENAKAEREDAKKELKEAKNKVKNLETELKERVNTASENAKTIAKQIMDETKGKIRQIENNATKVIEAEERNISTDLTTKAILTSVETAKNHINGLLSENPDLHDKYVDKSLNEIDRIKF